MDITSSLLPTSAGDPSVIFVPSLSTTIREQSCIITFILCSIIIIVVPFFCIRFISSIDLNASAKFIPLAGSSSSSNSGLALTGQLLGRTNLANRISDVDLPAASNPKISHADVVQSMIGLLTLGKTHYDDIEPFREVGGSGTGFFHRVVFGFYSLF